MKHAPIFFIILLLALLTIFASGCNPSSPPVDADELPLTKPGELLVKSPLGNPKVDGASYRLKITGEVQYPQILTLNEMKALPSVTREVVIEYADGNNRQKALWTGTALGNLLDKAQVKADADRVVFRCANGYETSLAVQDAMDQGVMLAWAVGSQPLPPKQGYPLRLVAEGKLDYKWAKWITEIRLIRGDHKGYWEGFGYDNEGDVRKSLHHIPSQQ